MLTLVEVLRGGRQCDEDGVEIIMSRQACCEAADFIEAAKQREMELLAVIEKIKAAFKFAAEMAAEGDDSDIREAHIKMLEALNAEPSQALREHEAKVLEEAAERFDGNSPAVKAVAGELRRMAEERRKK